jgi:arylsulfatase A-like enzyme
MSGVRAIDATPDLPNVVADESVHTIRVGAESRPARLVQGPQRIERDLTVPLAGARLELAVAPIRRTATLRVVANNVELLRVKALPGVWTPVVVHLSPSPTPVHVIEELTTSPEGVVAWSDDRLIEGTPARGRPDVILVSLDTTRPDYLSPYNPHEATPALARFAREATRFDQAISVSSWTLPAHEAIFTGAYPSIDGGRLDAKDPTLAEMFAASGYDTLGVSGGPFTDTSFGFQRGFASYLDSVPGRRAVDTTTWVLDRVEHAPRTTPMFAFVNYFDAHEPNTGYAVAEWRDMDSRDFQWTPEAVARLRDAYRHDVQSMDRELGRLFDGLRRTRDWRNTVVIVLSDHGQLLGERGMIGHALRLDEELIHVPLLVKPADGLRMPDHYGEQVQLTDVFPLTLELAGIPTDLPAPVLGRIMAGAPIRTLTFAQVRHPASPGLLDSSQWESESLQLVRTDTLRAMRDAEGRLTLTEIADRQHVLPPASMPSLFSELETFERGSQPDSPFRVRRDVLKRLRALGYIR